MYSELFARSNYGDVIDNNNSSSSDEAVQKLSELRRISKQQKFQKKIKIDSQINNTKRSVIYDPNIEKENESISNINFQSKIVKFKRSNQNIVRMNSLDKDLAIKPSQLNISKITRQRTTINIVQKQFLEKVKRKTLFNVYNNQDKSEYKLPNGLQTRYYVKEKLKMGEINYQDQFIQPFQFSYNTLFHSVKLLNKQYLVLTARQEVLTKTKRQFQCNINHSAIINQDIQFLIQINPIQNYSSKIEDQKSIVKAILHRDQPKFELLQKIGKSCGDFETVIKQFWENILSQVQFVESRNRTLLQIGNSQRFVREVVDETFYDIYYEQKYVRLQIRVENEKNQLQISQFLGKFISVDILESFYYQLFVNAYQINENISKNYKINLSNFVYRHLMTHGGKLHDEILNYRNLNILIKNIVHQLHTIFSVKDNQLLENFYFIQQLENFMQKTPLDPTIYDRDVLLYTGYYDLQIKDFYK